MATYFDPSNPYQLYEAFDLSRANLGDNAKVAESGEHALIGATVRSSLRVLAELRSWDRVLVGDHIFFHWRQGEDFVCVAPDTYLIDDPPERLPSTWRAWEPDYRPPRWVLEVVSRNWHKDYIDNVPKYSRFGCRELVVFDPELILSARSRRVDLRAPLTVFRARKKGLLRMAYSGAGPVFSKELGIWLAARTTGKVTRLRLTFDEAGKEVVPTEGENTARVRRQAAEKERQAAELVRQADERVDEAKRQAAELVRQADERADEAKRQAAELVRQADERADEAQRQADERVRHADDRADEAERRADAERSRREQMAESLRRVGVDPEDPEQPKG